VSSWIDRSCLAIYDLKYILQSNGVEFNGLDTVHVRPQNCPRLLG
jgi:hypothetical protein